MAFKRPRSDEMDAAGGAKPRRPDENALALAVRPYLLLARADKPTGIYLLLFPCWWGVALASPGFPDLRLLGLFALGAVVMRGAGCTLNDIADRDFDAKVARTRTRPVASGEITARKALYFMALLLAVALAVLLQFNGTTVLLGLASLPLVLIYPFAKRFTYWPQIFLGLAFNWGALMGWAAVTGSVQPPALLLYAAGICWTLGYDTIYAHQDREDDALIGVKSTALRLGQATKPWLFAFYAGFVALLGLAAYRAGLGLFFYGGLVAVALQAGWQAADLDIDDAGDCLAKFRSNTLLGWLVLASILAGRAF